MALRAFGRHRDKKAKRSSELVCQQLSSNYRLSEFQSAVLLGQLEKFPAEDARRQANAAYLTERVDHIPGLKHVRMDLSSMKHGYYYYLLRYEPDVYANLAPERFCQALNAEGIPFVPGDQKPLYRHPVFEVQNLSQYLCQSVMERYQQAVNLADPRCSVAEKACKCTLILRHPVLQGDEKDRDDIVTALWKIYRNIDELC